MSPNNYYVQCERNSVMSCFLKRLYSENERGIAFSNLEVEDVTLFFYTDLLGWF